jgi:hypothetical protein
MAKHRYKTYEDDNVASMEDQDIKVPVRVDLKSLVWTTLWRVNYWECHLDTEPQKYINSVLALKHIAYLALKQTKFFEPKENAELARLYSRSDRQIIEENPQYSDEDDPGLMLELKIGRARTLFLFLQEHLRNILYPVPHSQLDLHLAPPPPPMIRD